MDDGDPWLLLEHLQGAPPMADSGPRWRAVLRPCCAMIPHLSDTDLGCLAASDRYAAGELSAGELAAVAADAWARLPWLGGGRLTPELYAARAACALCEPNDRISENWFLWAWGVLSDCERAGVPAGELERRVRREFGADLASR